MLLRAIRTIMAQLPRWVDTDIKLTSSGLQWEGEGGEGRGEGKGKGKKGRRGDRVRDMMVGRLVHRRRTRAGQPRAMQRVPAQPEEEHNAL